MSDTAQESKAPRASIYSAISRIMGELEAIGKNRTNEMQRFKYRGIDDIYNALQPLLAKYGVFTVPSLVVSHRLPEKTSKNGAVMFHVEQTYRFNFYAEDGSYVSAITVGEAMDSGDKASNKAIAAAHKYALMQVFAIRTEDLSKDETDAHSHEMAPPSRITPPVPPLRAYKKHDGHEAVQRLWAAWKASGKSEEELRRIMLERYHKDSTLQLTEDEMLSLIGIARGALPPRSVAALAGEAAQKLPKL